MLLCCCADLAEWSERPFADWLQHRQLSARLTSFVAYAIALLDYRQDTSTLSSSSSELRTPLRFEGCVSTAAGIASMRRHFHSIGRYSAGASLYPIYGMGELPQAFARLCAVHGGIYILRYQPVCVVSELSEAGERRVKGVVSDGRQLITAEVLVCDREYVEDDSEHDGVTAAPSVSCAVCVVDGRVLSGAGELLDELVQCVFPPLSVHDNQHPVRVLQLSGSVKAAPEGQYVLYLSTPSSAPSSSAVHDLQPIVEYVTHRPTDSQPQIVADTAVPRKPSLLHAFYYKRKQRAAISPRAAASTATSSPPAGAAGAARATDDSFPSSRVSFRGFDNVFVTADSSPLSTLDSHIDAAQLMLDRLAPGVSLLAALTTERAHSAGGGDEEKQQLDQLNILNSVIGSSIVGEEDLHAATLADDESKEQESAPSPSILPTSDQQQQQQDHQLAHEPSATSTGAAVPSPTVNDENAVLDSLDDLTFS